MLKDASINCDTSAAIYVKSADKVFVTLAENTSNTLTNTKDFVAIDDNNIDAVIFSKSDLSLNGSGTLTIHAAYGHGIVSKDDLVITSGTYDITAARHALSGKDSVRIADGDFTLNAKKMGSTVKIQTMMKKDLSTLPTEHSPSPVIPMVWMPKKLCR